MAECILNDLYVVDRFTSAMQFRLNTSKKKTSCTSIENVSYTSFAHTITTYTSLFDTLWLSDSCTMQTPAIGEIRNSRTHSHQLDKSSWYWNIYCYCRQYRALDALCFRTAELCLWHAMPGTTKCVDEIRNGL